MSEASRAHEVLGLLDDVIDPELGIGILSLGLVYRITVDADDVAIVMTLTVPGCPMHATIAQDVKNTVRRLPWVNDVTVEVTFEPRWTVERMSESAKIALGRA